MHMKLLFQQFLGLSHFAFFLSCAFQITKWLRGEIRKKAHSTEKLNIFTRNVGFFFQNKDFFFSKSKNWAKNITGQNCDVEKNFSQNISHSY